MNPTALRATLESLRSLPREQAVVEFRSNFADPEKIGAYLSGLANTAALRGRDRAWLVWGVEMADALGQKAKYIHQRGLDDRYYQKLVLDYLQEYGHATRTDLDELLLRKLPDVLTDAQKANKVKNLMQSMKRAGLIKPHGARSAAVWRLC